MDDLYKKLLGYLKDEDKGKALDLCIRSLENNEVSVIELYQSILTPSLNSIINEYEDDENNLIWKEHVRSGIIRTIIENAYPYVLIEKNKGGYNNKGNVIVMCPRFEDHELGARMVSDFLTIAGYNTTFIGANTPEKTILKAIECIKPKYVSMSVTNYFNLVSAKNTIDKIKKISDYKITFLLGGHAFISNPNSYKEIGGDMLLNNFQDILNLSKGVESN